MRLTGENRSRRRMEMKKAINVMRSSAPRSVIPGRFFQRSRHDVLDGKVMRLERAFAGFAPLPPPTQWWDTLQVRHDAGREVIEAAFRRLALEHHPDRGGSSDKMAELNRAREDALRSAAA
jgi:hypothetical protein